MMIREFIQSIQSTDLVLTANNRLANYLRSEFDQFHASSGKKTWELPVIMPIRAWLKSFYQSHRTEPLCLLSPAQSLALWQQIVGSSVQMAALALQSWELFQGWELDFSEADPAFADWARAYVAFCKKEGCIDEACLAKEVISIISKKPALLAPRVFLVGFDNISNIINKLIDLFSKISRLERCHFQLPQSQCSVVELKNKADEFQTAARWIKNKLDVDPKGFYACVVPDLAVERDQAIEIFQNVLGDQAVNITVGKSLSLFPIIASALRLIALAQNDSDLHEICAVIRTPYILGSSEEFRQRTRLDNYWRSSAELFPKYDSLSLLDTAPLFQSTWLSFLKLLKTIPEEQKPSEWCATFSTILDVFAWPGDSFYTEEEKDCVERWQECITDFAQLDSVLRLLTLQEAISILNYHVQRAQYQAPTPNAKVHVMGILESSGLLFDGLWVMGLDDESWPQPLEPNPFLSTQIQRQRKMPRANPLHELNYAEQVLNRLKNSATEVIFSYPSKDEDKILQASPLLKHLPKIEINSLFLADYIPLSQTIFEQRDIEKYQDNFAPPVSEEEIIRGGTYILKTQAICPFKAFAEIRLHAAGLEKPVLGYEAADRGTLVHEILAEVWKAIQSSKKLLAMSSDELRNLLQSIISTIVDDSSPFAQIEKKRLLTLCTQWLEYEKKRNPFSVFKIEKSESITLGPLSINCRIDRMDKLEDETYVILDYKTGSSSVGSWFGERPDEPQLPLYCLATDLPISALAFAECRIDNQQFKGISIKADCLPDVKEVAKYNVEWEVLVSEWKHYLSQLATDFMNGKAVVDPKTPPLNCQYCEIYSLCRVR